MIMKSIEYESRSEDNGITTFFFEAPKELIKDCYPLRNNFKNAVKAEISIEVPSDNIDASLAVVSLAAVVKEDNELEYYWEDIEIPREETASLLKMAD